jgi:type VI secretion system protein ImpK
MNDRCTRLAYSVISHGLELWERLERGANLCLEGEQAALKDLLAGDPDADEAGYDRRNTTAKFLGIRYALVCWLDELFTTRSAWSQEWNEHKLEVELYGSNDRAWRFWEQAKLAQARTTTDALEVYFLCVMLGFRGALDKQPDQMATWIAAARQRLGQVEERDAARAGESPRHICAPPLRGSARLRQMALTAWVAVLVLGPLTAFYLVHRLGQ